MTSVHQSISPSNPTGLSRFPCDRHGYFSGFCLLEAARWLKQRLFVNTGNLCLNSVLKKRYQMRQPMLTPYILSRCVCHCLNSLSRFVVSIQSKPACRKGTGKSLLKFRQHSTQPNLQKNSTQAIQCQNNVST